jgi:hypothetical protein
MAYDQVNFQIAQRVQNSHNKVNQKATNKRHPFSVFVREIKTNRKHFYRFLIVFMYKKAFKRMKKIDRTISNFYLKKW